MVFEGGFLKRPWVVASKRRNVAAFVIRNTQGPEAPLQAGRAPANGLGLVISANWLDAADRKQQDAQVVPGRSKW
jgi:hypothetical protein